VHTPVPGLLGALLLSTALDASAQRTAAPFTDPRDGQSYPVIEIAGMSWLGRNLNFAAAGSYCYEDVVSNCDVRGRLYPWPIAMRSCPSGWHLSTEAEWQRLETFLGMREAELELTRGRGEGVGDALKESGRSGLDIPLVGWRRADGSYRPGNRENLAAALWTATEPNPDEAWHRDVDAGRSVIWRSPVEKGYSLSVRCVKD
jgi:uncharacterized protein (TIGR02145 family)